MPEDITLVEQGVHAPSTSPDIREGNTDDYSNHHRSMPLGVPLTGNLLFTISWILGLGVPKAIYSNRGQSLISPTLDWVGGIVFTLISVWLAVIEAKRPELCPGFFEVDLAPFILKFVCRHDVHLWFASFLPLLLAVKTVLFMEPIKRNWVAYIYNWTLPYLHDNNGREWGHVLSFGLGPQASTALVLDATTGVHYSNGSPSAVVLKVNFFRNGFIHFMLGASMTVFLFCLYGLRVFRPDGFIKGRWFYGFLISFWMWTHLLFLGITGVKSKTAVGRADFMLTMTMRLYIWMMPWISLLFLEQFEESGFLQHFAQYCNVILCVCPIIWEVIWGPSEFPETLYRVLFLCCALGRIWGSFSAIIPPSWIAVFTSAWETTHESIRNAGRKAKTYVLDVYRRLWESEGRES